MPAPKKPAFKPRGKNKGPASRSLIGRVREKNRFGVRGSQVVTTSMDNYAEHFKITGSTTIPSESAIGKEVCKLLRVRAEDKIDIARQAFGVIPKSKDCLIIRVTSKEGKGARYFPITRDHKSGLFNRIADAYNVFTEV